MGTPNIANKVSTLIIILLLILLNLQLSILAKAATSSGPNYHSSLWDVNVLCEVVYDYFPYCLSFLMGYYPKPGKRCCDHINKLNILAKHRLGPVFICGCIEAMVKATNPPLLASRIHDLPLHCNTHLSFPISESMDCTKY